MWNDTKRRRMNNGSIEKKNYQCIRKKRTRKRKKETQSIQTTENPHNDRQRTIAQTEGKRKERKKTTEPVGSLQLST